MRRLAVVALAGLVVAGCQDDLDPTVAPDGAEIRTQRGGPGGSPPEAALEAKIGKLLNELFPPPDQAEANQLFAEVKSALADDDTTAARSAVSDLLQLGFSTDLDDPKGPRTAAEGFSDLIDLLFEFVGLAPPEVDPSLLVDDDDDGTVQLALDGQDNLILSDSTWAGTFIEDGDLSQDLLIVLDRLTTDEQDDLQAGECLPVGSLDQAEGCYRFERFPEGVFEDEVRVGVCPEAAIEDDESYQLHAFEQAGDGGVEATVALPSVPFPELDCQGFTIVRAPDSAPPWRLAHAVWDATGAKLVGWIGAAPLRAIDFGDGGSTLDYSRIGWAQQMDVDIVAGDGQTATPGSQVATDPTVEVTHRPEGNDQPLEGVEVTFSVPQGGGVLNGGPNTTVTATTDANGRASVAWTLGTSGGTHELEASVAGESVVFTANAAQNAIFLANFDDEAVGSTPQTQDPEVGTWSSVFEGNGTIQVQSNLFGFSRPVVFDPQGGSDGQALEGTVAGTPPTTGQFDVSWQMAADTLGGPDQKELSVTDDFDVLATVELEAGTSGGDILAVASSSGNEITIDTGEDWSTGVARSYRVRVDLDAQTYSLFIDGTPVSNIQGVAFPDAGDVEDLEIVEIGGGGSPAQQFALDNIQVVPVP